MIKILIIQWDDELQKRLASHVRNRKDHLKNISKKFEI